MKWLLLSLMTLTLPAQAMSKIGEPPPSSPGVAFDADLFKKEAQIYSAEAELLLWTVAEGALDYALKMRHAAWGPTPSYASGRFETAGYDLDPGFRVGLHYFRAPHFWEVKWQYTRLTCSGDDKTNKPSADQKFINGTWPQILTAPLAGARSHIHLNYNVFDMLVSRVFFPNPHLRFRIIGGATMAWMSQDWKIRYFDSTPNSTVIRNKWDYIGGGLKTGSTVDWYWTGELYMTGLASFSVLMGSYSNDSKQTVTTGIVPSDNPNVPVRDASYGDIRPTFSAQMLLGPSWQRNYKNNRVELFAGFEMNAWFNLQEIYRSSANVAAGAKETFINTGILALYGITTRLTVDF